jgi:hypothetical protein
VIVLHDDPDGLVFREAFGDREHPDLTPVKLPA